VIGNKKDKLVHFLLIAEKLTHNIINNNNTGSNNKVMPLQYFSHLLSNPFPNKKLSNTSTQEIIRIINSLQSKSSHAYNKILTKILKISVLFICFPLNYITKKQTKTHGAEAFLRS
jgi:hypothetical protein